MATSKVDQRKLMKATKDGWIKNDPSEALQERYEKELSAFKKWAKHEDACQERLIACLGWESNERYSVFKCPGCGHTSARTRNKKEGTKNTTYRLIFECKKCNKTPSPRSLTIMARSSIPLGFWFLCIYAIGLMNGKVPWGYLNTQRIQFKSGDKAVNIEGRDLARIVSKILNNSKYVRRRMTYSQMVMLRLPKHKPLANYSTWHESGKWIPWRIAFKKDPYTLEMALACCRNSCSADEVEKVYICNDAKLYIGEWLLLMEIKSDGKTGDISWFLVSKIFDITDKNIIEDGYTKSAIFLKEDKEEKVNYPFKIQKSIKGVFREFIKTEFIKTLTLNCVKFPPSNLLNEIAESLEEV